MKVAVGCDHAGFILKDAVCEAILSAGHEVLDVGTYSLESVDYPDYAKKAGDALISGSAEKAVLLCGSGVGIGIAANKIMGVYAATCHDTYSAHQGVEHDGMNALCLGSRVIGSELAKEIVSAFLNAEFSRGERHIRRTDKVKAIESQNLQQ